MTHDTCRALALPAQVVKGKHAFERIEMTKDEALEMFKYNDFKTDVLKRKVPDGAMCTAYRCGDLIDLCRGPHVPDTSRVKAFSVMKNSSAYWQGQVSLFSMPSPRHAICHALAPACSTGAPGRSSLGATRVRAGSRGLRC